MTGDSDTRPLRGISNRRRCRRDNFRTIPQYGDRTARTIRGK